MNLIDLLDLAKLSAEAAGNFLVDNRSALNEEISNIGRDIKLEADTKTESLIRDILSESDIPILGEEGEHNIKDFGSKYWVVDPLDGTANFSRGIPISCVSIALIDNGKPILGVINDFNHNELYFGSIEIPSMKNNELLRISDIKNTEKGTLMTGLPANTDYSDIGMKKLIERFQKWKKVRMIGSAAMASIYVASGKAEMYFESGTNIWDVAAGIAIAEAAGGKTIISNQKADHSLDIEISNGKF